MCSSSQKIIFFSHTLIKAIGLSLPVPFFTLLDLILIMRYIISTYIIILFITTSLSQVNPSGNKQNLKNTEENKAFHQLGLNISLGGQLAAADLASRFGLSQSVGAGIEYIALPKGWLVRFDWQLYFSRNVKEDVLATLRTPEGNILGDIGTYASVQTRQRGFFTGINIGKLWTLADNGNRIYGLRTTVGAGYLQHKIRIQDNNKSAPQVAPPYSAGYDRLTSGPALTQSIGFQVVSRDKRLNGFIALECTEGFTRNRRGFNYDTRKADTAQRLDILYGIRAGWSIILYSSQSGDNIEY
jgi:hypothetical protein